MNSFRLRLEQTTELHQEIADLAKKDPARIKQCLTEANAIKDQAKRGLMHGQKLPDVAMTALLLDAENVDGLEKIAMRLHSIIEKVLNRLVESPALMAKLLPGHEAVLPFLSKTPGSDDWQVISRYDFAVTPDGNIQVMELNTCCPAGFMIVRDLVEPTLLALKDMGLGSDRSTWNSINAEPGVIVETVLELERKSGIEPGLIGVFNDENELMFELDQIVEEFEKRGRRARVIDARNLRFANGELTHDSERISGCFNKFRISTPDSPNHCWKKGFEERYADFLAAQQSGSVVVVNNVCGMSIAEDKGLLGILFEPEIAESLSTAERDLIGNHVLWTTSLEDKSVELDGSRVDLLDFVRQNKDRFVIKPANEGRGFAVRIGKYVSQAEWEEACLPDPGIPSVVQEFAESLMLPIATVREGNVVVESMFLTLALAITNGLPNGFISRVSTEPVTNVAKSGFLQAAFAIKDR